MIATSTGGAYGAYGLVFAQFFGRHVPGEPTVVPEYRPGAGGVVASNYLYNVAPKDGTVIGIPLAPIVLAQYTGAKAQYDASKFVWIGQMADITRLFAVWETSPIKTFQDLTTQESIAGTTGRGSETYMNPALMNHVFGTKIKIVAGYKGSNALMLALERGEISAVSGTWSNFAANHPTGYATTRSASWCRSGPPRSNATNTFRYCPSWPRTTTTAGWSNTCRWSPRRSAIQ